MQRIIVNETTDKGCYLSPAGTIAMTSYAFSPSGSSSRSNQIIAKVTFLYQHVPTCALHISISFEIKLNSTGRYVHDESLSLILISSSPFLYAVHSYSVLTIWCSPIYWPTYVFFLLRTLYLPTHLRDVKLQQYYPEYWWMLTSNLLASTQENAPLVLTPPWHSSPSFLLLMNIQ